MLKVLALHGSGDKLAQVRALIAEKKQELQRKRELEEKSCPEAVF